MKELDYLKDMLCSEIKKITQQSDFTTSTLETAYKIVDMLKDIDEIQGKEESHQYEKDGSYGYCEETGEPIGIDRLEARPVATLSVEAQERHERMEKTYDDQA